MNFELIRKYKAEFDYYVNGGKLLIRDKNINFWIGLYDAHWDMTSQTVEIIINDEYVEFRKAIADGKTIQYYDCVWQHELCANLDKYDWIDWKNITSSSSFSKTLKYRIKPEELQFKVGDFIRTPDKEVYRILELSLDDNLQSNLLTDGYNCTKEYFKKCIKWTPQAGELCWFTDTDSDISVLSTFKDTSKYNTFITNTGVRYDFCEPFIGTKPSWFKG